MTNYNDGNWHGWNGGECPVHPKSEVEVRYEDSRYDGIVSGKGLDYGWEKYPNKRGICAFRVIKEHREPREGWAYLTHMHDSLEKAEDFRAQLDANYPGRGYLDTLITHWREVVD